MMFGYGRDEAGILVEPAPAHQVDVDDDVQVAAYRNAIWLVITPSRGHQLIDPRSQAPSRRSKP